MREFLRFLVDRLVTRIPNLVEIWIVLPHVENHLAECLEYRNPERRLKVEFACCETFGHTALDIRDRVRECRSELAYAMFLDQQVEILILGRPADCLDECGRDRVCIAIEVRSKGNRDGRVGVRFLRFIPREYPEFDERSRIRVRGRAGCVDVGDDFINRHFAFTENIRVEASEPWLFE